MPDEQQQEERAAEELDDLEERAAEDLAGDQATADAFEDFRAGGRRWADAQAPPAAEASPPGAEEQVRFREHGTYTVVVPSSAAMHELAAAKLAAKADGILAGLPVELWQSPAYAAMRITAGQALAQAGLLHATLAHVGVAKAMLAEIQADAELVRRAEQERAVLYDQVRAEHPAYAPPGPKVVT